MPTPRRRTGRFVMTVAIVVLGAACGNRDLAVSTTLSTSTTSTTVVSPTTEPPTTTTTTTVAIGSLLSSPPSAPHIQVGLNDVTLILSLAGDLIGHVQPPLVGPEFYQFRQTRLTEEASAFVDVPEGCQVEAVLEAVSTWRVVCRQLTDNPDPTIGILSADGTVEVIGRIPPGPAGSMTLGRWGDMFDRGDEVLLTQFSGECEVPHAMFIVDGVARHVSGEGVWDDAPVPNSFAYGWLPDDRALVWTWHEAGCGSSDPEPGLYAYDIDGSRELLYPVRDFPIWGRIMQQG